MLRAAQIERIFPAVAVAEAILALISAIWLPSARKRDPRYLNVHTLSIGTPSQKAYSLDSWAAACCFWRVSLSAVEPR